MAVGRLQARAKFIEQPQPVQRQRLLQPLNQAARRAAVEAFQLGMDLRECRFGSPVISSLVGLL